jgi:hypothetical protein
MVLPKLPLSKNCYAQLELEFRLALDLSRDVVSGIAGLSSSTRLYEIERGFTLPPDIEVADNISYGLGFKEDQIEFAVLRHTYQCTHNIWSGFPPTCGVCLYRIMQSTLKARSKPGKYPLDKQ